MKLNQSFETDNFEEIDTPALLVVPAIIQSNIQKAITIANGNILRPHIKTSKTVEIVQMMIQAGITHYKCATIAEAELLAIAGALDVLIAFQPTGTNPRRIYELSIVYPGTIFSSLIDDISAAANISSHFPKQPLPVFIDLNIRMNRTGILPEHVPALLAATSSLTGIIITGIHAYDGHINDTDVGIRTQRAYEAYKTAYEVKELVEQTTGINQKLAIGGTPTFAIHAQQRQVECSPGTFVFWDAGYSLFKDIPFDLAAVLITRVISIISQTTLCLDLGHKAVASENAIENRVRFLNLPNAALISHSEEHAVVQLPDTSGFHVGDLLYAVPYHICPTVALHRYLQVVENGHRTQEWEVIARNRKIKI